MVKAGDVRKGFEKKKNLGRAERDKTVKKVLSVFWFRYHYFLL